MALDFMAIVSYGIYPTPTPTTTRRAALAVSMGLLNINLPTTSAVIANTFLRLRLGAARLFTAGSKIFMRSRRR